MHEDVHNIGLRIEAVVEDVLQDHGLGDRAIWIAHEVFQQSVLPGLQVYLLGAALHLAREQINAQVAHDQPRGLRGLGRAAD